MRRPSSRPQGRSESQEVRDREQEWARLAHEAWRRGQEEAAAGRLDEGLRWLDRAIRLAPNDDTIRLTLATLCLAAGSPRALALFEEITARHDVREAWMGLAVARRLRGDLAGAADALAAALSRNVLAAGQGEAAEAIAREAGWPGWCGLLSSRRLRVGKFDATGAPSISGDGVILHGAESHGGPEVILPEQAARAGSLAVTVRGRPLLGSPIRLDLIRRVEGFVETHEGGLRGWAWHPGDADRDPALLVTGADGQVRRFVASDTEQQQTGAVLARPRGFRFSRRALAGLQPPLRVTAEDGRDLLGSPLDPGAKTPSTPASRTPAPAKALPNVANGSRPAAIVVPVHGGDAAALACLHSVLATVAPPSRVIVVDDASPPGPLVNALDELAGEGRIHLLRQAANLGFCAAANAGFRAAAGHDVALLNSDTLLAPGWLERLRAAAYSEADIGTVTPLSNDATIMSYPEAAGGNPPPDAAGTARLSALAHRANAGVVVDVPTAIGFCMYIRRVCLDAVGGFREDLFAQGYGEENDFCLRATHLGWRHVAAAGVFVTHIGGASFGAARAHLMARNTAVLERLHPGYGQMIEDFVAEDPLFEVRRRMDLLRWRRQRPPGAAAILVTHDQGGGVERAVRAHCASLRAAGVRPVLLRPGRMRGCAAVAVCGDPEREAAYPNLRFALPAELPALMRLLRAVRPDRVAVHHLLGHHPAILELPRRLGLAHDVHVHDYAWFCPRISLLGPERRYCGEPETAVCESCVAAQGSLLEEEITVAALRARSAAFLGAASAVTAPSGDCAGRLRRHFPGLRPLVAPAEPEPPDRQPPHAPAAVARIGVIGAIGTEKGYDILLACARDAARRRLALEFVVFGYTIDDAPLLDTARVFITGPYEPAEIAALLRDHAPALAFLPSVVPETWCFTLTEAWRAGLDVAAFDIGAQAERIRQRGRGTLLPLGLPIAGVNDALLAAASQFLHECSRKPMWQGRPILSA